MSERIEILIIEDEKDILELIEYHIQKEGYHAVGFGSTQHVEQFLEEEKVSLMIVDRNLPDREGSEFIASLRRIGHDVPVIFLTAKSKESELEEGFMAGGDDYMTKPFSPKELVLRVNALLRRAGVLHKEVLKYKNLTLYLQSQSLHINDEVLEVSKLEFKLLYTFMTQVGKPLSRDFLRDKVWTNKEISLNDNAINVAISRLKQKIDTRSGKNYFHPVWGVGYTFK